MSGGKKELLSGWGNFPVSESTVVIPRNEAECKELLKDGKIIARGLGRSYADQAINTNHLVALCTKMNHFLSWDDQNGILECEAGVSLEEVITAFAPKGWFPMICPGTKFVTIGGAIANDIHGKAHHTDGSFVNCVLSFTILLADGSIQTASRNENADLFWGNFGGLGLLGIILTVRMQLRKIETTWFKQRSVVIHDLSEMLDSIDRYDEEYNYSVAWVDTMAKGKKLGSGVLTLGNAASLQDLPEKLSNQSLKIHSNKKISVPFYLPSFALNNFTVLILNKMIAYVQNSPKSLVHYEKFFFPLDAIGNWNRGYGKRGFIQYQFVMPLDQSRKYLGRILQMIAESGCTPFLNVFKRLGKGQGILSFPFEGYTIAIDFPVSKTLFEFIPKLDAVVMEGGGRIYLGKDAFLKEQLFQSMYPQYKEWLAIKQRYDPNSHFSSNLGKRLGLSW